MGADKKKSQCGAKRSYIAPGMTRIEGKHRKRSGNVIDIEVIGFYFMPDFFLVSSYTMACYMSQFSQKDANPTDKDIVDTIQIHILGLSGGPNID